ncbi:DUF6714 family protein [Calothrix sp. UHCC 0171]|uniref:DUF6714 family protein n=1 Tax=Calothrix sp. UHCC 0171 TaxID=3110245 RepID=UPI002B21B522|nr:DUF6714 family protein [Calothrix sp. UHCC 0171]MEA5573025.1 DUF6714 family protein [Calothrix sp. UHCC 0171]
MNIEKLYPCPCCGYRTLNLEPPGTYLICPICFWEDDGDMGAACGYSWAGSNQVCLRQAQQNFIAFGACELQWLKDVRSPTPNDVRDTNWQTIDDYAEKTRLELIEKINVAFKDVVLEDGVSLHEARALDDYEDSMQARQIDCKVPWQEIPNDWIEKFHDVFAFMDAKGFRHAVPAYMTWCLKYNRHDTNSFALTVTSLKSHDYRSKFFSHLDTTQEQVISEFLEFIDTFVWSVA